MGAAEAVCTSMAIASRKATRPEHLCGPDRWAVLCAVGTAGKGGSACIFTGLLRYIPLRILVACHVWLGFGIGLS